MTLKSIIVHLHHC